MARKQRSEAEKAQTELSERLSGYGPTVMALETTVQAIMLYHKMDHREAVCALRDYFQVEIAKHMDLMAQGLDEHVMRLRRELESAQNSEQG